MSEFTGIFDNLDTSQLRTGLELITTWLPMNDDSISNQFPIRFEQIQNWLPFHYEHTSN